MSGMTYDEIVVNIESIEAANSAVPPVCMKSKVQLLLFLIKLGRAGDYFFLTRIAGFTISILLGALLGRK